jgi:hypothetical protein
MQVLEPQQTTSPNIPNLARKYDRKRRFDPVALITLGLSLALHAGLLFYPIAAPKNEKKPTPQAVKITKINKISSARAPVSKVQKKAPVRSAKRLPKRTIVKPRVNANRPVIPTKPAIQAAKPAIQATEAPETSPPSTQTASNSTVPIASKATEFAFTPYPDAEAGCLQLRSCFATTDTLDQVGSFFEQQLVADGYEVALEIDQPDRKVYKFSKDGKSRYLNILNSEVSTVYAAADAPKTLADLQSAVEIPPEFDELIAHASGSATSGAMATINQFPEPDLFFSQRNPAQVKPEISGEPTIVKGKTPDQLFDRNFKPELPKLGFQIPDEPEGEYGGGPVYRMQQERSKPFFVNLIPAKDGSGSIIVVWLAMPPM